MTDPAPTIRQHLQNAVTRVLQPMVRLLLRHGISHAEFCNWAKQAYVDEAASHFGIDGKRPTLSRIAVVTGINRKEVKRITTLDDAVDTDLSKHNRAVRVITGWLQDEQFSDENQQPDVLVYGDASDSFNRLVKRYGGDVPARAVLDELIRTGTVSRDESRITLLRQGYVPHKSEQAMLEVFAISAGDLLATLEHNLNHSTQRRLQMSVAYNRVTDKGALQFKKVSAKKAMTLLRQLDKELSAFDRDANPDCEGDGENRVGLGIYLIDDKVTGSNNER